MIRRNRLRFRLDSERVHRHADGAWMCFVWVDRYPSDCAVVDHQRRLDERVRDHDGRECCGADRAE